MSYTHTVLDNSGTMRSITTDLDADQIAEALERWEGQEPSDLLADELTHGCRCVVMTATHASL